MLLDFTVAIPTYNGAKRLPLLLDRLCTQVDVETLRWEIIVVDNNSQDNTRQVVEAYQASGKLPVPLRYLFEAEQGAAFARQCAVRQADGEWIGFLDDDNLPASNWLAVANEFKQHHPKMGAFSGQIHGVFEQEPPANFSKIQAMLAIRHHGDQAHRFNPDRLQLPPAASLVIRRQAWLESVPERPMLGGRRPGFMVQGDDYEPLLYLHKTGWEIWYTPDLHSYHQIPGWRFEKEYLVTLAKGCGLATCPLCMINAQGWQVFVVPLRTFLGNLRRSCLYVLKYRKSVLTDPISAAELAFFVGGMVSPYCFLRQKLQVQKMRRTSVSNS